jgi:glycosyltransferase involved in cell wall biosynthesis
MRIVHVALLHSPLDVRIFEKEARELASVGYDVHVIAPGAPDENRDDVRFHGIDSSGECVGILSRVWLAMQRGWRALRSVVALRPDVVHLHEVQAIPVGLALKLLGARIVYDVHEEAFWEKLSNCRILGAPRLGYVFGAIAALLEVLAKLSFDGFVAATPHIGRQFPRRQTTVVQNFPRSDETPNDRVAGGSLADHDRENVCLFAGNLFATRGAREMVEAVAQLPAALNSRLVIAGRFVPASLKRELEQLDGWCNITCEGWLSRRRLNELWSHARVALVLFHPSPEHLNAYPNKLFEAMAAGVPVVASDFPLWRKIVESAQCGLLVDPLDPTAIADAVRDLLEHPAKAAKMGAAGAEAVRRQYNWNNESVKLLKFYEQFTGGRERS